MFTDLSLAQFHYDLPTERIAQYPLAERDHAKLLVYQAGKIQHQHFYDLPQFLPENSLLVLNDTKVVPARLYFQRVTGAHIEVLLLHPHTPAEVAESMRATGACIWECMIGNKKRWKPTETLTKEFNLPEGMLHLQASWVDFEKNVVRFSWDNPQVSWAELLSHIGTLPLPPYLQREAEEADKQRYQTTYAKNDGAVAAPTAGLHFTERVFEQLKSKNILPEYVTLHVSAGTFQPIKVTHVVEHPMHAEQLVFTRQNIENLRQHAGKIIAVGTTSMRALESLYWYGAKILEGKTDFRIEKLLPYTLEMPPSLEASLDAILELMGRQGLEKIWGETEIFMFPPYQFRVCKGLITNFHMPDTTLIMLVASFIGEDWRKVYNSALNNDYRFLSYGDSSLLLP
jgi:S-adenosylmethionine:tRNA ribosyltransferase-isomerase